MKGRGHSLRPDLPRSQPSRRGILSDYWGLHLIGSLVQPD